MTFTPCQENIDLGYYRNNYVENGSWMSNFQEVYKNISGDDYRFTNAERVKLSGPLQNWAYLSATNNNPYWLINKTEDAKAKTVCSVQLAQTSIFMMA